MNQKKRKDEGLRTPGVKAGLSLLGWALITIALIYRSGWLGALWGIGFLGWLALALISLYFGFAILKAREAKREGGWLLAIMTAIGIILFIALCFLFGFHIERGHLPL